MSTKLITNLENREREASSTLRRIELELKQARLDHLKRTTGIGIGSVVEDRKGQVWRVSSISFSGEGIDISIIEGRKKTKNGWHKNQQWICFSADLLKVVEPNA